MDEKIEITAGESELLKRVLGDFLADMRERKNAPKGWTYGQVQDGMSAATSLLAKLG